MHARLTPAAKWVIFCIFVLNLIFFIFGSAFLRFLTFYLDRINGEETRLMLWDTAGQEEFDAITKAYYRG